MHLAELNIGVLKAPVGDPLVDDFVRNLDRINALAERSPGFVWRLRDEAGNATAIPTPWPDAIANMSVWETPEQLEHFVWNTVHKKFYNRKAEWFKAMKSQHFVMWRVPEGHRPTLCEAKERLDHLDAHGNSDYAFGWSHLPHIKLWQSQRCA
jgi:hypothetical protein